MGFLLWLKRIVWLLGFYMVLRGLFLVFNYSSFGKFDFSSIMLAFVNGLRFDLSAIFISNILLTIFSFLPIFKKTKIQQNFLQTLYIGINIPLFWLNIADVEYYKFIGRRTIFDVFGIIGDIRQQAFSLLRSYWYLLLIWVILSYIFIKGSQAILGKNNISSIQSNPKIWHRVMTLIGLLGLTILIFRGGFQEKPLRINQAFEQHDAHLGNLSLNTSFTFLTTIDAKGTEKVHFFPSNQEALQIFQNHSPEKIFLPTRQNNVVIIILESFAKEYMGFHNNHRGYTPFLDSLAAKGIFMDNCFANGRESIMAVPAITASIPQLMDEPFITSKYQSNRFRGMGDLMKENNYSSLFFHGARNGSMGFEAFSQLAGFDAYFGLNQYPKDKKEEDFDGNWGIFDEPYLHYFADELTKTKKPFLSCVFTLSSHHPYAIPRQYWHRFPKGNAPIHESIGYSDFALKQFFEYASQQPWYHNTLFVITADHTQMNTEASYRSTIGQYRVPLIFFHPNSMVQQEMNRQIDKQKICQHIDIFPTVLDFLQMPSKQILPFGQSIFVNKPGVAFHYNSGIFRLFFKDNQSKIAYSEMDIDGNIFFFDEQKNRIQPAKSDSAKLRQMLQAYIQYYRNGLIDNDWIR